MDFDFMLGYLQVWDLTLKTLKKNNSPSLNAKAKETHGLLGFSVLMLQKYKVALVATDSKTSLCAQLLLACGTAAQDFDAVIDNAPSVLTRLMQQDMMCAYLRHMSLFERSGHKLLPKHHKMLHMIQNAVINPKLHHTYRDESINGVLAEIARAAHRFGFADDCHHKYAYMQQLGLTS